jgi:RHS repeat-associated protein
MSSDPGHSAHPIRYASGEIRMVSRDLSVRGYGQDLGHTRSFSNRISSINTGSNGNSWFVKEIPQLGNDPSGNIAVIGIINDAMWFDKTSSNPPTYSGRFFITETLTESTSSKEFTFTDKRGQVTKFYSFNSSIAAPLRGQLKSIIDPYGNVYTPAYNTGSSISSLTIGGSSGVTFSYSYYSTGNPNAGKLQYATHMRGSSNVRRVSYVYYETGDSNGNLGDLKESTVQQWNGSSWDNMGTTYYRYYTSNSSPGYQYGLKYVVRPQAYAAMVSAGITPETTNDSTLRNYADHYFEYNNSSDKRVSKEVVNAQGTTSSSATSAYNYSYAASGNTNGYNNWNMKTVETLPDGNTNTVYTNYAGQVMLKILTRPSDGKQWYQYYQYDGSGRETLQANSSAIASVSETSPALVTLNTSSGFIRVFYYYTTTNLAIGAVAGMLQYEKIKNGSSGSEITVREVQYTSQTANGITIYLVSKDIRYQSDSGGGSNPAETDYAYTFFSGTLQVQQRTTTLPAIPTSQNGSGTSNTRIEIADPYGFLTWIKDERGFLTRFQVDQASSGLIQRIDDVATSQITDSPSVPTGWTTPSGGGLHLITDFTPDSLGRVVLHLGPPHSIDLNGTSTVVRRLIQTLYLDAQATFWQAGGYATGTSPNYTYNLLDPVAVNKLDQSARITDRTWSKRISGATGLLSLSGAQPDDFSDQTQWVTWEKFSYNNNERAPNYKYAYFSIPSSGLGTKGTNYNETDYDYDAIGRFNRILSPAGTITRLVYNARGLLFGRWVGTNDSGATDSDPTGGGNPNNNMVQLESYLYDAGDDINTPSGDGNLTTLTSFQDATTTRVMMYGYDFRRRRTSATGPASFYGAYSYDNQNRLKQVDQRNAGPNGNLIARGSINYDNLGRIYQRVRYAVNPATGQVGNSLTANFWYDPSGNLIKVKDSGSSALQKAIYDGIRRPIAQYISHNTSETAYPYPVSVANDVVFEQLERTYDSASNQIQQLNRKRMHNASGTGTLGNPTSSPTARVYYQAWWPDVLGRPHNYANYGTNGAAAFARPTVAPARSDTVLVETADFNSRGEFYQFTDAKGSVSLFTFDDARRLITRLENYIVGGTGPDQNLEFDYTYNPDGRVQHLTAKNGVTGDQVTKYVYGVDLTNSDVASNQLLRAVIFPDSSDPESPLSGTNHIEYQYNRLGQMKQRTDQVGTVHVFEYDGLGRLLNDRVTTVANGVDSAVRRISITYEVRGKISNFRTYDNATVGLGTVINDVQFGYNSFGQVIAEYQSHSGVVNTAISPVTQYGYADGSANTIRPTSITYPNGQVTVYDYGTSGGSDDLLSRVTAIKQGSVILAGYTYLGWNRIVNVSYSSQPGVALTYIKQSGESNGEAGDQYIGLDRFGRVVDQRWMKSSTGAALERIQYGFDRVGNRVWRQNLVRTTGQDEYYSYDGARQLVTLQRGTLRTDHSGINGTPSWEEDFNYDPTGNWHGLTTAYKIIVGGTTSLDQNRSHSTANAISGITTNSGTAWTVPVNDLNGNASTIPQPASLASSFTCVYDAWNRVVNVKIGAATLATYKYDGFNRRVKSITTEARDYYYGNRWRLVEERTDTTDGCAERQFVWGLRYPDDLVLRDRRTTNPSSSSTCAPLDERLYVLHDFFNVSSVVSTSGTVQERYGYDAFGGVRFMDANFNSRGGSIYGWETLYGAYKWDGETGLYLVRNRYLHPKLGRWLTRDPIYYRAGINIYRYVGNNPTNSIDITGLFIPPGDPVTVTVTIIVILGIIYELICGDSSPHTEPMIGVEPGDVNTGPSPPTRAPRGEVY